MRPYWGTQYAYARIQFTLSQLIGDGPASLTFSVNNKPVYSCKVAYTDGQQQILYVPIPVDMLNIGYNSFGVTGYVRIYDDEGCIDDLTGANWVRIEESSFVTVGYDVVDSRNEIQWYPYPFLSTTDETGSRTAVAVSDAMSESELAAALLLRADCAVPADRPAHGKASGIPLPPAPDGIRRRGRRGAPAKAGACRDARLCAAH